MENAKPLVSIIMPAFNREKTLPISVGSILEQGFADWELIIVDDGSADGTTRVAEKLGESDSRIRCIRNERTKGVGGARNTGMLAAKGDFIAFLDSDDQWLPFHLEESLRMIEETGSDAGFALWVERQGETISSVFDEPASAARLAAIRRSFPMHKEEVFVMGEGLFERYLKDTLCIFHINTMVFKREKLKQSGLFLEEFHIGEDTAFMINFFDHSRIVMQLKPHSIYNLSPDSVYFFVDRRKVDPDNIHENKELQAKLEKAGLQALAFKFHMHQKIAGLDWKDRNRLLFLSKLNLARQYYTLSYLYRFEKRKALRYCFQSMKYNVNLFNLLLLGHIIFSIKRSNSYLRRPVDLW